LERVQSEAIDGGGPSGLVVSISSYDIRKFGFTSKWLGRECESTGQVCVIIEKTGNADGKLSNCSLVVA